MAFVIRPTKEQKCLMPQIADKLRRAFNSSRFNVPEISVGTQAVSFVGVRLWKAKPYCGSHPGPCLALFQRKEQRLKFLEGADWVEFNDLVNDVLDELEIDAGVVNAHLRIRRGRCRRTEYNMVPVGMNHYDWEKTGHAYDDCCGKKAPRSQYPEGTPGGAE